MTMMPTKRGQWWAWQVCDFKTLCARREKSNSERATRVQCFLEHACVCVCIWGNGEGGFFQVKQSNRMFQ